MSNKGSTSRLATAGAQAIMRSFETLQTRFAVITQRAQARFESGDAAGMQKDARQRLLLYQEIVSRLVVKIEDILGDKVENQLTWTAMKAVYSSLAAQREDWNIAETFFNSITRRIFATVGVNEEMEFVASDYDEPVSQSNVLCYKSQICRGSMAAGVKQLLQSYRFTIPYRDIDLVSKEIGRRIEHVAGHRVDRFEFAKEPFFRPGAAYLVGRIVADKEQTPFAIALIANDGQIDVDAVLLSEKDVSKLFSFTRSYFLVGLESPYALVTFLKQILPAKRIAELYIAVGLNKHGKTELYREIHSHINSADEQFVLAPGQRGMVMRVFTMPSYDLVFKLIRDKFDYPKTATRQEVKDKYRHVFLHDRAGRLVDAQEFEHLKFPKRLFSDGLLSELRRTVANNICETENHIVISHAYVQRRVVPLDIYMRESDEEVALAAAIDFGYAIKDLVSADVFPGDMLLKNFGTTRHGRVVFYDYDEISNLEDCKFRKLPVARDYEDEMASEPWFAVDEDDVFPEEFVNFLGLQEDQMVHFMRVHSDLFDVTYWLNLQKRIAAGQVFRNPPYPENRRLRI